MKKRLSPVDRSGQILAAAVTLAGEGNLYSMSGYQVGEKSGCSRTLINQYFGSITNLRNKVIEFAMCEDIASILSQAMASNDPMVIDMTTEQKARVGAWVGK